MRNVGELIGWLTGCSPGHAVAFAGLCTVRVAVNLAKLDHLVADGDNVAFFPPVTGG